METRGLTEPALGNNTSLLLTTTAEKRIMHLDAMCSDTDDIWVSKRFNLTLYFTSHLASNLELWTEVLNK